MQIAQQSTELGRFFVPGPTEVRPHVLEAMTRPMVGHRTPEMQELIAEMQPPLRDMFQTKRPVYVVAASGTGMMEAAVRNAARRRVLSLVNGAFSERFFRIALATGLDADKVEVEWGAAHSPEQLEDALRRGSYDAVTVVHSETSTGVLNPIRELAGVTHAAGDVMILVDSVSGIAGAPVYTDDWSLDVVVTGSQKAIALPPGLGLGVAQTNVLERAKLKRDRGTYFDFIEFEKNIQKNQTPNTPAVSLMYALAAQLATIRDETIERRWQRHAEMAERTYAWVDELKARGIGLEVLAPEGRRSPTVTAIRLPEGWTGPRLAAAAAERGFRIAPGYGKLRDATFRIGHMGDHTLEELDALLEALDDTLQGA